MKFRAATYDVLLTELTRAGAVQRVEQIATALAPQLGSYARGIVATFELAIGALTEGGRRILALASLCEPNSPVPTFVLEEGTLLGPDAATVAYFEVVRASLLEHSAATEKMPMGARIHPITSYVAVLLLNPDVPTLQRWLALPMLERFVEAGDGSAQRACAPFVQQAVHVAGLCESDAAWALRSRAASYFLEIGDFENAHIQAERAYRVYAQLHGDDTGTLTRLNDLALVKLGRGDHEAARVLLQQVREKRESLHGAMHPKTMESAGYEALALSLRGDRLAAESLFRSVVDHQVAAHGAEALQTATTTYHMAASLADWGRYAEARSLLEPLVATLRQGTEDTRLLALALSAFGTSVEKVDGPARALDLHGEAVAVAQQSAGGELVALTCKANRAVCLSAMGRERDTLAIHTEVLARRRELLPRDHPDVIPSLFNAGSTHMGLAEPHAALPLLEEGLDLCRRVNGGGHLKTVLFLHALGVAQNAVGEHDRAQSTLEEGLKALENLDGDARMVRIGLLREVGLTRRMRGDLQGARTALVEALDLARALHGDASAESIDLAEGLLVALHAIGDVEAECEVLEFQVRSRRERFGATSAELLDTLEKLVAAYRFGKQPRRALDAARRLLDVCGRAAFGRNHQRTLKGRHFMAMLLRESGDTSTCRAIWRDILPKLVAQRGPEDDLVTDAYLGLIETFELPRDERAVQAITKQFPLTVVAAAKRFSKM
jgi:tetratricopeptide (TPR) repeat protein